MVLTFRITYVFNIYYLQPLHCKSLALTSCLLYYVFNIIVLFHCYAIFNLNVKTSCHVNDNYEGQKKKQMNSGRLSRHSNTVTCTINK